MKQLSWFFLAMLLFTACEVYSTDDSGDPYTYMGGGKWVFYDYEIVVISAISEVKVHKSDTICINSFNMATRNNDIFVLSQDFKNTPIERRFIAGQTVWEFEGSMLYCDFGYGNFSLYPSHKTFYVEYNDSYLYSTKSRVKIINSELGTVTNYTFETNNQGLAAPNKLTLLSPPIVIDLYDSKGSRDKAITIRVLLRFMR